MKVSSSKIYRQGGLSLKGHETEHSGEEHSYSHAHGVVDPELISTDKGLYAVKWAFVGLMITALFQILVVWVSGSVALLADTIHNFGDAATAIPLGFAFLLSRKKPNKSFTYGYGRAEDLAGLLIVFLIFLSAVVAAYQSVSRLISPQPVNFLWAVAAASIIGFLGNELVAKFRIRVGKRNRKCCPCCRWIPCTGRWVYQPCRAFRSPGRLAGLSPRRPDNRAPDHSCNPPHSMGSRKIRIFPHDGRG